ncbi:MAG: GHKL domain-containing protein, partial [Nitrospira sp.]
AEFEALHRVAAFCLHDLKNLTAQLSLVVQNAEAHGHDPRFQKSALRTVTGTVQKMMTLMAKLSLTTPRSGYTEDANVHAAVAETIRLIAPSQRSRVRQLGESVPSVRMARDQLHQVLLNVILNAQQAVGEQGEIRVLTARKEDSVVITVSDSGPGIGEERLRTLFRPFRSTKQGGFGLGLYECKRILAGYHGTIRIDSEVGKGTRVTMTLPCALSSRHGQTSSEAAAV